MSKKVRKNIVNEPKVVSNRIKQNIGKITEPIVQLNGTGIDKIKSLIIWDNPTKIFVGLCAILFFIGVVGKFHFSHSPIWYQIFGENAKMKKSVIWGKPHTIRSDEWLVEVPHVLSQSENGFSSSNPSIGPKSSVVIHGMPVVDFLTYFRPAQYGFIFLDVERAFSWLWMYRSIGCVLVLFLFLKLFLNNNFKLSVFGSLLIFLSSGIQWWGIFCEAITGACAASIFIIYIFFSKSKLTIGIFSILIVAFTFGFIITPLYPPRQVPIVYLVSILTICYFIINYSKKEILNQISFKAVSLFVSFGLFIFLLWLFYLQNKETIEIVFNTVYPGRRISKGGDLPYSKLFSEYFWIFITPEKLPSQWANICEASGFILFFPIVFGHIIYNYITKQKQNLYIIAISAFLIFCLFFMFIGLPEIIAKITLFSMVPPFRLTYGFGVANLFLLIIYLQAKEYHTINLNFRNKIIIMISSIAFIFMVTYFTNKEVDFYFSNFQIIIISIFFGLLLFLAFNSQNQISLNIFIGLTLLFISPNVVINPLSRGLDFFLKNPIYTSINKIVKNDKDAKWVVFGNQMIISNFIKSTGANVWSGVKYVPDMKLMHILDKNGKQDSVYNRYAHIVYMPYIDNKDSVIFNLAQMDLYSVSVDPCSPKLKEIGIKYFLFTYQPQPIEVRCMELVESNNFLIYKRKD